MMDLSPLLNFVLGAIVFVSIVVAVLNFQDELDVLDRFILAGLAGSMLLTTPALWISHTPFDGWSFNLSRAFLAAICLKRFVVPVIWKHRGDARQRLQVEQSAARLFDRKHHQL